MNAEVIGALFKGDRIYKKFFIILDNYIFHKEDAIEIIRIRKIPPKRVRNSALFEHVQRNTIPSLPKREKS